LYRLFLFYSSATRFRSSYSEYLLIPESKDMAETYCSALCNLSGMCEFFMTTKDTKCPHSCNIAKDQSECILFTNVILYFTFKINEKIFFDYDIY